MKYKFFCDENITKELQNTIRRNGFQVDSVRNRKLFGAKNGDLITLINSQNFTLITFDKDFLEDNFSVSQGIIILDVNPNRDELTIPLLEKFLNLLKKDKIDCTNRKIVLNQDFLSKLKKEYPSFSELLRRLAMQVNGQKLEAFFGLWDINDQEYKEIQEEIKRNLIPFNGKKRKFD